ncbi:cutinase family protein [Mycobacterium sp.]|uniref:cutinase family protein n=1 Tax=Mycobacterium sp. TaxID=1785 RepID=UPI002D058426|nr:cutinase family protein [Mycobacterium sp.]HKP41357.1 cutinase family protein [Mycobacterium sp.]
METAKAYRVTRIVGALVATAWALPIALINLPTAAAEPCPDVEIVFARGTTEPPGVGGVGQAFVDAFRSQLPGRSIGAYAVDYPASNDFANSTPAGANDASAHIQSMAANCPNTRMVLGGYSQGAGVIDLSTSEMPTEVSNHVAAAALFGAPKSAFADSLSPGPLPTIGALYATKTIDLCVPNDPICSDGWDMRAHVAYIETGMVSQAATFAASRL